MSKRVWMQHLPPHTRALAPLAPPTQGMASMAWHGLVWYAFGLSLVSLDQSHFLQSGTHMLLPHLGNGNALLQL